MYKYVLINKKKQHMANKRTLTQSEKAFFEKKIRFILLGETNEISRTKVVDFCKKFFQFGLEYQETNNGSN